MRAGSGEAEQRGGELLGRDDPEVRASGRRGTGPRRRPPRTTATSATSGNATERLGELRGRSARTRRCSMLRDHFAEPAQASPERHVLGEPGTRTGRRPAPGRGPRRTSAGRSPPRPEPCAIPRSRCAGALFSEAPDARQPALPAGALERVQRVHAERVVEDLDLSRAEARNAQALRQTARERRSELVVQGKPPGPNERLDVSEDRRADARDVPQPSGPDRLFEIAREGQQGLRGPFVSADLETIRARELEHLGDLRQHASDLSPIHRRSMTQDPRRGSPLGDSARLRGR